MLAQNFKTAADLEITEPQADALRKTLVLLETDKLEHYRLTPEHFQMPTPLSERKFSGHFNMRSWTAAHDCGTACCIGGTAELVGGLDVFSLDDKARGNYRLYDLFYPKIKGNYSNITPAQAATALRSYLTTGDARWDLAVA